MKRIVGLVALIVIAFAGWKVVHKDAAEEQYKNFAEEVLHRRYETAATMASGLGVAELEKLGSQERIGAGPQMFQTLFPSKFNIDSRDEKADGSVVLHATQTVLFNPVGVESAVMPAMYAKLKQVITLREVAGVWKVTAFENTFESMDSVRR